MKTRQTLLILLFPFFGYTQNQVPRETLLELRGNSFTVFSEICIPPNNNCYDIETGKLRKICQSKEEAIILARINEGSEILIQYDSDGSDYFVLYDFESKHFDNDSMKLNVKEDAYLILPEFDYIQPDKVAEKMYPIVNDEEQAIKFSNAASQNNSQMAPKLIEFRSPDSTTYSYQMKDLLKQETGLIMDFPKVMAEVLRSQIDNLIVNSLEIRGKSLEGAYNSEKWVNKIPLPGFESTIEDFAHQTEIMNSAKNQLQGKAYEAYLAQLQAGIELCITEMTIDDVIDGARDSADQHFITKSYHIQHNGKPLEIQMQSSAKYTGVQLLRGKDWKTDY